MRQLSLAELDAVSGGSAGWDSCDYNSEMSINMPIEDHGHMQKRKLRLEQFHFGFLLKLVRS